MLIKSYGQFWNPEIIDWGRPGRGNSGKLIGEIRRNKKPIEIDFWDARGIYVLYSEYKPVYVGKAVKDGIGCRLRSHLSNHLVGRWDMFSWFSVSSIRITQNDVSAPGKRQLEPKTVIETFEALSILIADPALNRKRESLHDAHEAIQAEGSPRTIKGYLEEILKKLDSEASN